MGWARRQPARAGGDSAARRQRDGQCQPGRGGNETEQDTICGEISHRVWLRDFQGSAYSSRYDEFLRGDIELTEQEERGVKLFKDPAKGNCASCHLGVSRAGTPPPFTDFDFVNVGVPRNPGIAANADPAYYDLGLCGPTRQDFLDKRQYCGFFRSPTVRNTATREAFFHNGVFTSLRDVLHFYNERDLYPERYYPRNPDGSVHRFDDLPPGYPDNIDHDPPLDRKPGAEPALSEPEIDDLIAFLETLNDGYIAP